MNIRTAIISTLAFGSLTICGAAIAQSAPATTAPMQKHAGNHLASGDKGFLENAAQAGHAEIEGGKLAQSKSQSPDVKAFADQMIKDHTKGG